MTTINWAARRADTAQIISEDPWAVTVYRKGRTPDQTETTWSFTGRIQPVGGFGSRATEKRPAALAGELGIGEAMWGILAPWDTPELKTGDEVRATQAATAIERVFDTLYCSRYAYKIEVVCHERE